MLGPPVVCYYLVCRRAPARAGAGIGSAWSLHLLCFAPPVSPPPSPRLTLTLSRCPSYSRRTPLPYYLEDTVIAERGVDVCDRESLARVLRKYRGQIDCIWNLAAPLSVDTANDPSAAQRITTGGMQNILDTLVQLDMAADVRVCFTDSIGSFGLECPREGATGRWLTENPTQDPGSDYGRQKRACRELLLEYTAKTGGALDTRWAVVPGVLHADEHWGGGTTEYALDAICCAAYVQKRNLYILV